MGKYFLDKMVEILGEEDRGVIFSLAPDNIDEIETLIDLNKFNTKEELQVLRNYLVMVLSKAIVNEQNKIRPYHNFITIVTHLIDHKIFNIERYR